MAQYQGCQAYLQATLTAFAAFEWPSICVGRGVPSIFAGSSCRAQLYFRLGAPSLPLVPRIHRRHHRRAFGWVDQLLHGCRVATFTHIAVRSIGWTTSLCLQAYRQQTRSLTGLVAMSVVCVCQVLSGKACRACRLDGCRPRHHCRAVLAVLIKLQACRQKCSVFRSRQ